MHEWALAEGVISTAVQAAAKERLKEITEVKIKLGELQQIDSEIFQYALQEVIRPQKRLLVNAKIVIETEKAILECRVCRQQWPFKNTEGTQNLSEANNAVYFLNRFQQHNKNGS